MTALPKLRDGELCETGLSMWHVLLQAEETALKDPSRTQAKYNDPLIGIRVLGFLLKDFWDYAHDGYLGSGSYARMVTEITSCRSTLDDNASYNALVQLGLRYRNYLFRVFRSNTGSRPTPSRHVSPPSFDVVKQQILKELTDGPQAKLNLRKQALLRDGYKCAISGLYDMNSCFDIEEINAASKAQENSMIVQTEVAHIFPGSAQDGDNDYAAAVFAILEMFGLGKKAESLYGDKINGLHNVITMANTVHEAFDSFTLWLEPVPKQENTYAVCGKGLKRFTVPIPSHVTFSVDSSAADLAKTMNKTLMLPDPVLIAIRAACARVANLSGAAEQADRILRDLEDITVLADDGSMAELLSSRLSSSTHRLVDANG